MEALPTSGNGWVQSLHESRAWVQYLLHPGSGGATVGVVHGIVALSNDHTNAVENLVEFFLSAIPLLLP